MQSYNNLPLLQTIEDLRVDFYFSFEKNKVIYELFMSLLVFYYAVLVLVF